MVSLDSSPDIEEVIVVGGFKQVDKENVAAVTIVDDDIVGLSENLIRTTRLSTNNAKTINYTYNTINLVQLTPYQFLHILSFKSIKYIK